MKRLLFLLCWLATAVCADEALGPVYPIKEEAADSAIIRLLKEREARGELQQLEREAIARSIKSAKNPKPVANLKRALRVSRFTIDATLTIPRDVVDPTGQVIARAGTTVNPLTMFPFTQRLVFFDGTDPEQVAAVRRMLETSKKPVLPILVAGSWYELAGLWKQTVYQDQQGKHSERFGVTEVPALIEQIGEQLILTQMPASEFNK